MKCTRYFVAIRARPDRRDILDAWIRRAVTTPVREVIQADGETVHNAFFDRGFLL
ncbi:MAG: hypothetical protein ABI910_23235 [Gemmatimonadota bacterium]